MDDADNGNDKLVAYAEDDERTLLFDKSDQSESTGTITNNHVSMNNGDYCDNDDNDDDDNCQDNHNNGDDDGDYDDDGDDDCLEPPLKKRKETSTIPSLTNDSIVAIDDISTMDAASYIAWVNHQAQSLPDVFVAPSMDVAEYDDDSKIQRNDKNKSNNIDGSSLLSTLQVFLSKRMDILPPPTERHLPTQISCQHSLHQREYSLHHAFSLDLNDEEERENDDNNNDNDATTTKDDTVASSKNNNYAHEWVTKVLSNFSKLRMHLEKMSTIQKKKQQQDHENYHHHHHNRTVIVPKMKDRLAWHIFCLGKEEAYGNVGGRYEHDELLVVEEDNDDDDSDVGLACGDNNDNKDNDNDDDDDHHDKIDTRSRTNLDALVAVQEEEEEEENVRTNRTNVEKESNESCCDDDINPSSPPPISRSNANGTAATTTNTTVTKTSISSPPPSSNTPNITVKSSSDNRTSSSLLLNENNHRPQPQPQQQPHPPTISLLLQFDQVLTRSIFHHHVHYFCEYKLPLTKARASWMYGIFARLEKPLHRDECASIRSVLRECCERRWNLVLPPPPSSSGEEGDGNKRMEQWQENRNMTDENIIIWEQLTLLNTFIAITGIYFEQAAFVTTGNEDDNSCGAKRRNNGMDTLFSVA